MSTRRFCLALSLFLCALPARAVDLTQIERSVAREPTWKNKPKYCLLVFGPEAKFRVWLVLDGSELYVDRDGSGDLTAPGKRVAAYYKKEESFGFRPGHLGPPGEEKKYHLDQLRCRKENCDMSLEVPEGYSRAGYDGPGPLRFAEQAKDTPIIHFLGPLTLQRFEPQDRSVSQHLKPEPLVLGNSTNLALSFGTPGLGAGTFAKYPIGDQTPSIGELRFADGQVCKVSFVGDD